MNIELLGLLVRLASVVPPLLKIAAELKDDLSDHEPLKKQLLDLADGTEAAVAAVRKALA